MSLDETLMAGHNNGRHSSLETWTNRWKFRDIHYLDHKPTADVDGTAARICTRHDNAFACSRVCNREMEIQETKKMRNKNSAKNG